jgi:ATP-dependent phosphofructokinase / diphosphate-dependent phosphofructokinase
MHIGILTGGGDSPAINGAIRAVVRRAHFGGHTVYGYETGWRGVIEDIGRPIGERDVSGILPRGGTMLGTSRTNPFKIEGGIERVKEHLAARQIDALITIGGDDTNGVARRLCEETSVRCVGIPQTIDNDIPGTEFSIGFDSALNIVMEALDRLHTTATSHHRVMVCEIMGRDAGWLALLGGMAGGADEILIPEVPFDLDEVIERLKRRRERGKSVSIVAIAEGAKPLGIGVQVTQDTSVDEFGHVKLGGIGNYVACEIEKRTGFETRTTVLGHLQRGGEPTAFDRVLATMFGVKAVELLEQGASGVMVVWQASEIRAVPFHEALVKTRLCPDNYVKLAELFR